jgi:transcriptional regulator with XRE-family HTH domain
VPTVPSADQLLSLARRQKLLSQKQVSNRIGLPLRDYRQLESGGERPTPAIVARLMRTLELSYDQVALLLGPDDAA